MQTLKFFSMFIDQENSIMCPKYAPTSLQILKYDPKNT